MLKWPWALALVILTLDQLAKYWIVHIVGLPWRYSVPVTPFLSWTWVENRGISMGLLDLGDQGRWILVAVTAAIAAVVAWWLARERQRAEALAFAAILGGAIGNIVDRARLGYVIDFVHVTIAGHSFYVFNVADAAITVGVVILLVCGFAPKRPPVGDPAQ